MTRLRLMVLRGTLGLALLMPAGFAARAQPAPDDPPTIAASDGNLDPDTTAEDAGQADDTAMPATQDAPDADASEEDAYADAPTGRGEVSILPADWKPYWTWAPPAPDTNYPAELDLEQLKLLAEQIPAPRQAAFGTFMARLNKEQAAPLLDVTRHLKDFGLRGMFADFLIDLPANRQIEMLDLIGSFDANQARSYARELSENPRSSWIAVPDFLHKAGYQATRALMFGHTPCRFDDRNEQLMRCTIPPGATEFLAQWRVEYATLKYTRVKVHGKAATKDLAPWQAQIFRSGADARALSVDELRQEQVAFGPAKIDNYQRWHLCGGALIEPGWVLTAAHCITPPNTRGNVQEYMANRSVRLGSLSIASGGTTWDIDGVVVHSKFVLKAMDKGYDIALLRIARPRPNEVVNPRVQVAPRGIGLAGSGAERPRPKSTAYVTGWGFTEQADATAATRANNGKPQLPAALLQAGQLQLLDIDQCNRDRIFGRKYQIDANKGQLCAGSTGVQTSCRGDSGGPLVSWAERQYVLVGLVSLGIGCGRTAAPSVFTDVAFFKDWIREAKAHYKRGQVSQWP